MNEFKTVVESFRSEIRKVAEVTSHVFEKVQSMDGRMGKIEGRMDRMEGDLHGLKEQVGLLMEGQTELKAEIRAGLKDRVTYQDFEKLEKRVTRLERKTA